MLRGDYSQPDTGQQLTPLRCKSAQLHVRVLRFRLPMFETACQLFLKFERLRAPMRHYGDNASEST
jgi:hypothetical protein